MKERELRSIANNVRGACPDSELLVRFAEDSLPDSERSQVDAHLLVCGWCLNSVQRLRDSELAAASKMEVDPARKQKARERVHRFLGETPSSTRRTKATLPLTFALAASLALLAYPAYLGLRQMMAGGSGADLSSLQVVKLESAVRGASAAGRPDLIQPEKDFLGLMFFVPIKESPDTTYNLQILRGATVFHQAANIRSFDGIGNFFVILRAGQLEPGNEYLLTVTESGAGARTWQFPFAIDRKSR